MKTPIIFRYVYQHDEKGTIMCQTFDISEIEDGQAGEIERYSIIARNRFTGMKDSSGKEIYEGDILGTEKNACVVGFENGTFTIYGQPLGWDVEGYDHDSGPDTYDTNKWAVVQGNIYENPELMNESKYKPQTTEI